MLQGLQVSLRGFLQETKNLRKSHSRVGDREVADTMQQNCV